MAAPATHIILAKKIYDQYCSDKNEADFFRGTEFADIRYIANIDRNLTHFNKVTLNEIITADAFTAGLKTHSLVDLTREQFVKDSGLYALLPESKYLTQTLKAFEDEIVYDQISDWQKYVNFLDNLSDLELTFGIEKEVILDWHRIIQDSIRRKPDPKSIIDFLAKKLNLPDAEEEITRLITALQQINEIKKVINQYINSFDSMIEEHSNLSSP